MGEDWIRNWAGALISGRPAGPAFGPSSASFWTYGIKGTIAPRVSNPIVIEVFCPQEGSSTPAPGVPVNRRVRLQTVRMEKDTDLTKTIFDSAAGGVAVTIDNLNSESKDLFVGGKKYKLTIEPIE
jgi:hypothetical protein